MTPTMHHPHPIEDLPASRAQKLLRALTSYYAIALAVAVVCAWGFGWLADEVLDHEFTVANTSILLTIHAHRTATLDQIAFLASGIGSATGITIIGIALVLALLIMNRYVDLGTLAAVLLGATVLMLTFKLLFHQVRPHVFEPLVRETNFSFPSGHSLTSFSLWGFLAWWIVSMNHRQVWRWILGILGLGIAVLVALSRLYLGVHWPTDVVAGMLLGFSWVGVCVTGQHWLTRHARRERRRLRAQRMKSANAV
ncbi:MAG: phosphatase PAP2 family protein [Bacteroidota bacterium]|nr:phosphatase PAP2 family protein [Bacteroidota bacterium]MDP4233511.1 phosphatase PAP2 family protein [Bacteroidota bacterium]MDP4243388.1 phosphatase PAP2 family protein [Bacteroidota bacterium]MDP4287925.1 phosphatase PAP2 family protein [Bacteroidota bacterium]